MRITGNTKVVALLGYPVTHSLSPAMQNAAFDEAGLDWCYVTFAVTPEALRRAVDGIRALNLAGANVTVPHKEAVIPLLDELDPGATAAGAVNVIVNRDGRLVGYNTDGDGFMRSLAELGIETAGKRVMLLGAGGAARGIGYKLAQTAGSLGIFNRNAAKAVRLAERLNAVRPVVEPVTELSDMKAADIIVNATPLGLSADDPLPLDPALLGGRQVVGDLIYKDTRLLREASRLGCRTFNGMGMLLWQGALAFELWTGQIAPVKVMRTALFSTLR